MKFVSLFTKAPNYKRFSFSPRYYDQQAEERKEREERIRREIEKEKGIAADDLVGYKSRMTGSFQYARKRSKVSESSLRSSLIRLGVLLFLALFLFAFLQWGKAALYSLFLFVPVYFYLKFKK